MSIQINDDTTMLHYVLTDETSHTMNAQVEADSSVVYVRSVNYISSVLKIKCEVQTKALKEGSIIKLFRFIIGDGAKDIAYLKYILLFVVYKIFFEKKTVHIDDLYDGLEEDEKRTLSEILEKKQITEDIFQALNNHLPLKVQRSTFFKNLYGYRDLKALSIETGVNYEFARENDEFQISATDFNKYIETFKPNTITVTDATLYIVSPVIVKGKNINWKGFYEGNNITFDMLSAEFKTKAQNGDVDFRTGFNINCKLQYNVYDDANNTKRIKNYKVLEVYGYNIDDHYIETLEGKKKRINDTSPNLFDGMDGF